MEVSDTRKSVAGRSDPNPYPEVAFTAEERTNMSEQNGMNFSQMSGAPPVVSPQVIADAELIGRTVTEKSDSAATAGPNFSSMAMATAAPKTGKSELPEGEVARIMAVAVEHMDRVDGLSEIREAAKHGSMCSITDSRKAPSSRGRRAKLIASLVACAAVASGMIGLSAYRITHPDTLSVSASKLVPSATANMPTTQLSLSDSTNYTSAVAEVKPAEVAKPVAAIAKASPIIAASAVSSKSTATSGKTINAGNNTKQAPAPVTKAAVMPTVLTVKPFISSNLMASNTSSASTKTPDAPAPQVHMFTAPKVTGLALASTQPIDIKGNFVAAGAVSNIKAPQQNMTFLPPKTMNIALAPTQPVEINTGFALAGSPSNIPARSQVMTFVAPKVFVAPKPTNLALAGTQPVELSGGFAAAGSLSPAPKHQQAITFVAPKADLALLAAPVREPSLESKASLVTAAYTPARPITHVAGLNLKLLTVSAKNQPGGWIAPIPMDSVSEHRQFVSHVVSVSNSFGAMASGSAKSMTSAKVVSPEPALMQAVPMSVAAAINRGPVSQAAVPMTVTADAGRKAITGKVVNETSMAEAVPAAKAPEVMDRPAVTSTMISIPVAAEVGPNAAAGKVVNETSMSEAVPAAKAPQVTDRPAVTSTQISAPVAAEVGLKPAATGKVVSTGAFSEDVPAAKSTTGGVSRPAVTSTEISTGVTGPVAKVTSNGRVVNAPSLAEAVPAAKVERTEAPRSDVKTDVMGSPVTGISQRAQPKGNISTTPVFNQQSGQAKIEAPRGQVEMLNMPAVIGEAN
jgi:hypothetical protein